MRSATVLRRGQIELFVTFPVVSGIVVSVDLPTVLCVSRTALRQKPRAGPASKKPTPLRRFPDPGTFRPRSRARSGDPGASSSTRRCARALRPFAGRSILPTRRLQSKPRRPGRPLQGGPAIRSADILDFRGHRTDRLIETTPGLHLAHHRRRNHAPRVVGPAVIVVKIHFHR